MLYFGLIGSSLSHSFSRNFFTAKFAAEQRAADYSLIEVDDISSIKNVIAKNGLVGFNVTIPYKKTVMAFCNKAWLPGSGESNRVLQH